MTISNKDTQKHPKGLKIQDGGDSVNVITGADWFV